MRVHWSGEEEQAECGWIYLISNYFAYHVTRVCFGSIFSRIGEDYEKLSTSDRNYSRYVWNRQLFLLLNNNPPNGRRSSEMSAQNLFWMSKSLFMTFGVCSFYIRAAFLVKFIQIYPKYIYLNSAIPLILHKNTAANEAQAEQFTIIKALNCEMMNGTLLLWTEKFLVLNFFAQVTFFLVLKYI